MTVQTHLNQTVYCKRCLTYLHNIHDVYKIHQSDRRECILFSSNINNSIRWIENGKAAKANCHTRSIHVEKRQTARPFNLHSLVLVHTLKRNGLKSACQVWITWTVYISVKTIQIYIYIYSCVCVAISLSLSSLLYTQLPHSTQVWFWFMKYYFQLKYFGLVYAISCKH